MACILHVHLQELLAHVGKEALMNQPCNICERGCVLTEGNVGGCGQYALHGGRIVERFADRYLVACPISVETMPMLHFHPGAKFFQISTSGCNLDCEGCISTVIVREMSSDSSALKSLTPEQVVDEAMKNQCGAHGAKGCRKADAGPECARTFRVRIILIPVLMK